MTLETALLSALSVVTTALGAAVRLIMARLEKSESTVEVLRVKVEELERNNGSMSAQVEMFERCPKRVECPFFQHPTTPHVGHA